MTKSYSYTALKVQQTPSSEPFYLLSCPASELLDWCDVPRKKEDFKAGYQRTLGKRHEEITKFFSEDDKNNIIPNAVIIAGRDSGIEIRDTTADVTEVVVTPGELDFAAALTHVLADFENRLSKEEKDSLKLPAIDESDDEDTGSIETGDDSDNLPQDAPPPHSYMASITKQLQRARDQFEGLGDSLKGLISDYVLSTNKPGLIIDGQHRVYGARNVNEFDVKLPVVLLPGLSHREQVFHFYVLNNKAKPLNKTELRSIIATSLTKNEIDQLYNRFSQVGVTAENAELTHRINNDPASPFRGLVHSGLPGSSGVIEENVAYQVVNRFVNMPKKYKPLYSATPAWSHGDIHFKLKCFYNFWNGVKQSYPKAWADAANNTNGQILQKVSLLVLQEYLLEQLNNEITRRKAKGEAMPFDAAADLEQDITLLLSPLKETFFTTPWKAKGLDTSTGHEMMKAQIRTAAANQCSHLGNMQLFRAPAG